MKAKREVGSLIDDLDYPSEYEDSNAEKLQNTELLKNNDDNENNMNIKLYTENNEKIIENTLESHKDEESFMPPNLATTPSVERNNNKDDDAIFPGKSVFYLYIFFHFHFVNEFLYKEQPNLQHQAFKL